MNDNTELVFLRLKDILNIKSDKDLATFLGLKSISNYKKRNYLPYDEIIQKAEIGLYHLDYVFLGVGKKQYDKAKLNLDESEQDVSNARLELLQKILKYGNEALFKQIDERLDKLKDISELK
ncbi:MAG: hypothetical protein GQ570_15135 [Helicobacteraceae bacterium]|nr:hypothetical protein [Helicobacteraceae bacterium]